MRRFAEKSAFCPLTFRKVVLKCLYCELENDAEDEKYAAERAQREGVMAALPA